MCLAASSSVRLPIWGLGARSRVSAAVSCLPHTPVPNSSLELRDGWAQGFRGVFFSPQAQVEVSQSRAHLAQLPEGYKAVLDLPVT